MHLWFDISFPVPLLPAEGRYWNRSSALLVYAEMCVAVIAIMYITYVSECSHLRCCDIKLSFTVIERWRRVCMR